MFGLKFSELSLPCICFTGISPENPAVYNFLVMSYSRLGWGTKHFSRFYRTAFTSTWTVSDLRLAKSIIVVAYT